MRVFVGLDGGGSGARAQAELDDGRRTPVVTGGPANMFTDPETAMRQVLRLLDQTMARVRAFAGPDIDPRPEIVLGLAGVTEIDGAARLQAALPLQRVQVLGDIDIALRGAFREHDGIVMAVGTGAVLARQRAGQMQRIGGYGFVLGDEGSGAWIGREALRHALHARDGLGPEGPLVDALRQRFGTLAAILSFAVEARPADFAALAPLVLAQGQRNCPVAGKVLDHACGALLAGITRLQDGAPDVPVAATGGIGPHLLDRIQAQGGNCPNRAEPMGTALDGALWQARRNAAAAPAASGPPSQPERTR